MHNQANGVKAKRTSSQSPKSTRRVSFPKTLSINIPRKNSNIEDDGEEIVVREIGEKWKVVRKNLSSVVNYGRKEGLIHAEEHLQISDSNRNAIIAATSVESENDTEKKDEDVIRVLTDDVSLAHSAIPFLPLPIAIFCLVMNTCLPGTGTIISGLATICMGQPRLTFKEGRVFMSVVINFFVGIAQLVTVTFMLVGWFWSIAWGGLMLMRAMEYRAALMRKRQEAVATAAIEALTKDAILRRRDVQNLVQDNTERKKTGRRQSSVAQMIHLKIKKVRSKKKQTET